jgi:hypothetical protein
MRNKIKDRGDNVLRVPGNPPATKKYNRSNFKPLLFICEKIIK